MIKISRYLKPYLLQILIILGLTYLQVMVTLQLPDYLAKIVNEGIVGQNQDLILHTGLEMLVVSLFGGACMIATGFFAARVATAFARDMRSKLFTKVESFALTEFNTFSTSSLITRSTNDIQQVQTVLVMILRIVVSAPITAVGAIIKASSLAPSMTWIMALAVAALITIIVVIFALAIPKFTLLQKLTDKLNLVARENLTGIRVIRAFNAEKTEQKKFENVNTDLTKTNLFVSRITVLLQPIMIFILSLTSVAIIWFGSHAISTNDLQIGNMLAFMQYAMQVIISFLLLSIMFILIPRALVSARRITEVMDTDLSIKDPEQPKTPDPKAKGVIEFKDVTFSYNKADTPVLQNISFVANPGETTAFIGSTGSGKSTLINLIPRFFDVSFGKILIDGTDIRDIKQEVLHDKIGYVPQKAVLFSGSIEANIKFGDKKATDEQMRKAAEIAQALEFINALPDKFSTSTAQEGTNFSGGQKQRISIARAIIKNPEIYIFDDSFSALDFKTDAKLRSALEHQTKGKTVLIVAQRINTIMFAEKIIVLDEGRIVGSGTHKQLMETCEVYKEIASSQLSEAELKESLK